MDHDSEDEDPWASDRDPWACAESEEEPAADCWSDVMDAPAAPDCCASRPSGPQFTRQGDKVTVETVDKATRPSAPGPP